MASALKTLCG
ncbi:hypothetical protein RDI58_024427 [Solanum bulbocastanum]|uniref:Uncharacterized protein n=1 Tax=Solanum bulbocastanum TaxID=147425 RepID=A0AAN8T1A0_SOLBU